MTNSTIISCSDGGGSTYVLKAPPGPFITVTIDLTSLPDTFTYDLDTTQNGAAEYRWSITFDTNNNATLDKGDVIFDVSLVAFDATPQQTIPRGDLRAYLWERGDANPIVATQVAEIGLETTATSLTFSASARLLPSLASISNGTQIYVETQYKDKTSGTYYMDYYPAVETYTSGLDTSLITDGLNDFETYIGPVIGKDFPFIDIEKISVAIM